MKIKQYLTVAIFFSVCLGLCAYSFLGRFEGERYSSEDAPEVEGAVMSDESYFKKMSYYLLKNSGKVLELKGDQLTLSDQNRIIVTKMPEGKIYRKSEAGIELDPIYFKSLEARGLTEFQEIHLKNEVEVKVANSVLKSKLLNIFNGGRHLEAIEDVSTTSYDPKTSDQIVITAQKSVYRPEQNFSEYQGEVKGVIQRRRKYEESLKFSTDTLTHKGQESIIEMSGNVALNKGNLDVLSHRGIVYLENYNKRLKYYALSDDVRLQETLTMGQNKTIRKAFSEKLEGIVSENKVVLTGLPKVFQGRDVIKGNRITIRENVESVEVDDANTNITLESEKSNRL